MTESLKRKTYKGASWSFIDNMVLLGANFVTGIVLARLLTPAEFGIVGLITVFLAVSTSLVDSGFSQALINKQDLTDVDCDTVFVFNLLVSASLAILLIAVSPWLACYYGQPLLDPVMKVMSSILVINGLSLVHRTLLIKKIDFRKQAIVSFVSSVTGGILGIVMAYRGYGVWSLVALNISRQLLVTCLMYILVKWKPHLRFSLQSFKGLFRYGFNLLLSGLIFTLSKNIYYHVIGKYYSAASLGQYTRAEQFNNIGTTNLTSIVQRVSFPVLSAVTDTHQMEIIYRKVILSTCLLAFPFILGVAAIASPLVLLLIGEQWRDAAWMLRLLSLAGLFHPLINLNLSLVKVKSRTDLYLRLEFLRNVVFLIPSVVAGLLFGIRVMLIVNIGMAAFAYLMNASCSGKLSQYTLRRQLRDLAPVLLVSAGISGVIYTYTFFVGSLLLCLFLQVITAVGLYILIYELLRFPVYLEIKNEIMKMIK
ncbi:MAG: lipopolysaccharide biosynthesis protein [Bacteroides sp.]|nr:lipopolysaccharide biosynthesis protein [Bacteroides sp.]